VANSSRNIQETAQHHIVSHHYGSSSPIDYKRYAILHGFAVFIINIDKDIDIDNKE